MHAPHLLHGGCGAFLHYSLRFARFLNTNYRELVMNLFINSLQNKNNS